jgi:adenine phosphoribosyltransferase
VDDVLSTGGTLRGIVNGLRSAGAEVLEVLVVADKGGRAKELEEELDVPIKCLLRLEVRDGRVFVLD